jgi:hypothetical protein
MKRGYENFAKGMGGSADEREDAVILKKAITCQTRMIVDMCCM